MKKILLIALLTFLSISSFGQKIRFTDTTNRWTIKVLSADSYISTFWELLGYSGSIYIDSQKYLKLSGSYIREDTVLNKVYIRYYNTSVSAIVDTDEVLYDYNWRVGDTVIYHQIGYPTNESWVTLVDSTQINGLWYKVWHFDGQSPPGPTPFETYYYNIIEGIGCTNNLFYPVNPYAEFEHSEQLTCFQTTSTPLSNPVSSWGLLGTIYFDNAASCTVSTDQFQHKNKTTITVPNPTDATSKIILPHSISVGKLVIVNDIGQTIVNATFQNKDALVIGDKIKAPGMYYYRVMDDANGAVFSGKFVNQ